MLSLILKSLLVAGVVLAIGLLAEGGKTALAALLVQLPVFSLGAFWLASSSGRETLEATAGKTALAVPVFAAWVVAVWAALHYTSLPTWATIGIGLTVWFLGAALYLYLVR